MGIEYSTLRGTSSMLEGGRQSMVPMDAWLPVFVDGAVGNARVRGQLRAVEVQDVGALGARRSRTSRWD